jgi:DNA replication protein DnaC
MERLHAVMGKLALSEADALVESRLEQAVKDESSYAEFLLDLLESEWQARADRNLQTRLKLAKLPYRKTLEGFDFDFQPSIDARKIRELRTLRWMHEATNVIFLGPPGVGKTHLSIALSIEAMKVGGSAYFVSAADLVADLTAARKEGKLSARMRIYQRPKVLVIDEIGYLPLEPLGGTLLFQLVSARYERGSIVLTSNKSYGEWGSVFGDPVLATAILDRLLHHSQTVNIRGKSYRLKDRERAGFPPPVEGPSPDETNDESKPDESTGAGSGE